MTRFRGLVLSLALGSLICSTATADVVVLRSGTVMEGNVASFDGKQVVLRVEAGETVLEREKVGSIHFGLTKQQYEAGRQQADATKPVPGSVLAWGASATTRTFTVSIASARIATTVLRDIGGDAGRGKTPDLQISLVIKNTHDLKILRYREPNMFLASPFQLHDDVENQIRGINYGFGTTVVGALTGNEDIMPGLSASHLLVFSVPPPQTKHVVLSVDLSVFGEEGQAKFLVPVAQIAGFPPR